MSITKTFTQNLSPKAQKLLWLRSQHVGFCGSVGLAMGMFPMDPSTNLSCHPCGTRY